MAKSEKKPQSKSAQSVEMKRPIVIEFVLGPEELGATADAPANPADAPAKPARPSRKKRLIFRF